MPFHYTQEQTKPLTNTMPWCVYGRVSMLERWAEQLCNAANVSPDDYIDWSIVARAVMIVHPVQSQHKEVLAKVAVEAEYNLIELTEESFMDWVTSRHVPTEKIPALVYVPQGVWSAKFEATEAMPDNVRAFRSALPEYLANLEMDTALVFVTTGDSYANLSSDLRKVGLFDRRFDIAESTLESKGDNFIDKIGRGCCDETLMGNPEKVGYLIEDEFGDDRRQSLIALAMKRRSHSLGRKVGFNDLVHFAMFGGGETDHPQDTRPEFLRRVAVHEAGHILAALLDSDFKDVPDYAGIVSSQSSGGRISDCYEYHLKQYGHRTFSQIKHRIRVLLGGRIAESLVLGPEEVSFWGARSDLLNAARFAKHAVGKAGFSAKYNTQNPLEVNLLVADDEPDVPEEIYTGKKARAFLKMLYIETSKLLQNNRGLLDHMANVLMTKNVLTQREILDAVDAYQKGGLEKC